ncbi:pyridoxal-phosphate dependent enzyme [Pedobacter sp. HMF7647]|uniref:Pyridoxal-phosphate dependent enzyme n=1 Tax=Hufsiella arboris TaxID=2695275 RepID=A0A7K1Y9R8_9SPHI|nr:pyridoxal-phosphate dependent enzyme [Hufsiella arboris]MXV51336.1 pyridoxal-phosphate dependent enzyme [Hufsiella arboris]
MQLNTPEEEIFNPLYTEKGVRVFMKRDDMIHPFISGNKWRKLKYILRQAETENKKLLVTFGGAWSNHLLATACAAAKFGFQSVGFVRGEDVNNPIIAFCKLFGMHLRFVSREEYRDKQRLFDKFYGTEPSASFIDEGGAGPYAAKGCAEIISELEQQYEHIFCAAGTGTTSAGIINGLIENKLSSQFYAVSALKGGGFLEDDINSMLTEKYPFNLLTDYHFGGYAKTNENLITFIKRFAASTGILLDPVYTGKMMFALHEIIERDNFKPGDKILAIHTGGLMGLLGKADSIYSVT